MTTGLHRGATNLRGAATVLLLACTLGGCGQDPSTAVVFNLSSETLTEVELLVVAEGRSVVAIGELAAAGSVEVPLPALRRPEEAVLFSGRVATRSVHADCGDVPTRERRVRIEVLPDLTTSCVVE